MRLFEELLTAWRYTREGVIAEVENLPESKLHKPPLGLGRSGIDLVNHIIESSRMMAGELGRPDGDFLRVPYPKLVAEYLSEGDVVSSKEEAAALLRRSQAEG